MKKKPICGHELTRPQLSEVSCPNCGIVIGRGAFLNSDDPCFDISWKVGNYVVVEGCRVDRNGALVSLTTDKTICARCAVDRRGDHSPWPEAHDRRGSDKK